MLVAALWLLVAQPPTVPAAAGAPRRATGGGGDEAPRRPPDLSPTFDPFAPDDLPPPRPPRFDPARPDLAPPRDPLAALIRNGPSGAVLPASPAPEPWRLPGVRPQPSLADPPPGEAPVSRVTPGGRAG